MTLFKKKTRYASVGAIGDILNQLASLRDRLAAFEEELDLQNRSEAVALHIGRVQDSAATKRQHAIDDLRRRVGLLEARKRGPRKPKKRKRKKPDPDLVAAKERLKRTMGR